MSTCTTHEPQPPKNWSMHRRSQADWHSISNMPGFQKSLSWLLISGLTKITVYSQAPSCCQSPCRLCHYLWPAGIPPQEACQDLPWYYPELIASLPQIRQEQAWAASPSISADSSYHCQLWWKMEHNLITDLVINNTCFAVMLLTRACGDLLWLCRY